MKAIHNNLIEQWRKDVVGEWRAELAGVDLLLLEPSSGQSPFSMTLNADGAAKYGVEEGPPAPFPTKWELSADRVLTIWLPIAPMPEYGMDEWSREQMNYEVLAVSDLSLCISNRRIDGEDVTVLRGKNVDEHIRRRVAEFSRMFAAMQGKG